MSKETQKKAGFAPAKNMDDIAKFIDQMSFRRKWFGGVSELDVLKKMELLQREYRSAYEQQTAYYQALIDERDEIIRQMKGS